MSYQDELQWLPQVGFPFEATVKKEHYMAMGQNPAPPVNIIPTKIDQIGWCTYPKNNNGTIGFDPQPYWENPVNLWANAYGQTQRRANHRLPGNAKRVLEGS